MNQIKDFLTDKKNENKPQTFRLFHGTNRKFTEHSIKKNRTQLNDKFQGDWICYSDDTDVGWKYASAARNQCFDRTWFLEDLKEFFDKDKDNEFGGELYDLMILMMEKGYDCWDEIFEKHAQKHGLTEDESSKHYFDNVRIYEAKHDFCLDDFCDMLDEVEYSKMGMKGDTTDHVMNMFNNTTTKISEDSVEFLKKLGFTRCIPETRLMISQITANKILKTNNREKAKNARDKGYDLVIYNGEGTVDNKPEYLVANSSQVDLEMIIVKNTTTVYLDEYKTQWQEKDSYETINFKNKGTKIKLKK
jgi:hypothetical protein